MPRTESSPSAAAGRSADEGGRVNQKRRTQRALFDAATALCEEGRKPTFAEVAERAMVSRATAYRYFNSVEALISEAMFERAVQPPEQALRPGEDAADAMGRVARDFNKLLLDDEVGLHVMQRSFMAVWLDNEPPARPPRPGRRMQYIAPVVESLKSELSPGARKRLAHALAMVMGPEAVLAMRDVGGASVDEAIAAGVWAAKALVNQARAEAAAGGKNRHATRNSRSGR